MKKLSRLTLVLLATVTLVACGANVEDEELVDDVTVEATEVNEAE